MTSEANDVTPSSTQQAKHTLTARALTAIYAIAPALRSRNFRLFWAGQLISVTGTSVQVVAEGWLIYDLTQSTFWLGMVGLLALIPVIPISFVGGVLIDRVPRRKLILATQIGLMAQAGLFGVLAVWGEIRLWHVILLYFMFGALLAIDHPARRAFLVELVGEEDLANAVALNATIFNMSSLIGYALAGLMIASIGVGITMMFNAFTYVAPIIALLFIRVLDVAADRGTGTNDVKVPFVVSVMEGLFALMRQPEVLGVMSLMAIIGGLAYPVFGMMPAFAEDVVQAGSIGLGILLAAGALGSVLGTVIVAKLGAHHRGRTLTIASVALPLSVLVFAYTRNLWLACLLLVIVGLTLLILQSMAITLVQVKTDNSIRGRVMTIYSQLHAGSDTMSNVVVGSMAVYVGLPAALAIGAAVSIVYAAGLRIALPVVARLD